MKKHVKLGGKKNKGEKKIKGKKKVYAVCYINLEGKKRNISDKRVKKALAE